MSDIRADLPATSVMGMPRRVRLERGQPGRIAITIYAGKKPITAVVTVAELRAAIERLVPVLKG